MYLDFLQTAASLPILLHDLLRDRLLRRLGELLYLVITQIIGFDVVEEEYLDQEVLRR